VSASDDGQPGVVLDAAALPAWPDISRLERVHAQQAAVCAGNLWGSSQALALAALAARSQAPLLVVTSTDNEADAFRDDLLAFGLEATLFPARESYSGGGRGAHADVEAIRARLVVAGRLAGQPAERPRVLVASVLAMLQPIPTVRDLEHEFLKLRVGDLLDAGELLARLVGLGYTRQPLAEAPGEVSLRGDILDLYPFASELPVRIELFEDEIESLRTFEPADQRSIESSPELELCLAADTGSIEDGAGVQAGQLLSADTVFVEIEPLRVEEHAEALRIQSPAHERELRLFVGTRAAHRRLALQSLPGEDLSFDTRSVQGLELGMRQAAGALRAELAKGTRVLALCNTAMEARRFREYLDEQGGVPGLETALGTVTKGFRLPALGLVVVNHRELKGLMGTRRLARKKHHHRVRALQSFFELRAGDLVVHAVHGLARFIGLERVERGGGNEEHLHLEFADGVSLFVPAGRIDMVQRYIGAGASTLALDKIGGTTFRKRKERVERGLFDLASDLIGIQAQRAMKERPSWSADEELVKELLGSFPWEDTVDQAQVDIEISADLYGPRPMDRLLCGDVGFGKTELAVRAAFRVVNGGGQVAVLVPTTVLAQQHFETFSERLADFPVEVAMLSRYVTGKAAKDVVERTARGAVDILIGTHRILSQDIAWKRLGLVIIDEEQRFGVAHKEHFKRLRAEIDMLTLTATPIPRTLHMSLSGIRDISALTVPPEGRQEIETLLGYSDDDDLVREAILRETNRGGQVFFLHNRVSSIEAVARRLQHLAPNCTFAVGHGQMSSRDLRAVMDSVGSGETDVLVATTIIENGLDIPTAGTILIDDADRFGLSELHQLRGRVGRGEHKAYCYLLLERHKPIRDIARQRLKALEELNHLGAGFGISVKDLELRGAGNILGAEQSGHIAAVGYDMFCRLLKLTIERLQSGEPLDAVQRRPEERDGGVELELGLASFLPEAWIPSEETRLELLRQMAQIATDEDRDRMQATLRDRFGRMPPEALTLLRMFRLAARLAPYHLTRLAWQETAYLVQYEDPVALERLFSGLDVELRKIRRGVANLVVPAGIKTAEAALDWFEGLLPAEPHPVGMGANEP